MTLVQILEDTLFEAKKVDLFLAELPKRSAAWRVARAKKRSLSKVMQKAVAEMVSETGDMKEAKNIVSLCIDNVNLRISLDGVLKV